jgi:broad specificity phosphatase PhoE
MSTLWLVRHAQASFLESDYDQLSALGHEQARLLGAHWAELGIELDRVVSGPRRRQRHTAELCVEAMRAAGARAAAIEIVNELDEYRADEIIERYLPELINDFPELGHAMYEFQTATERRTRGRAFDRMLQRVLKLWAEARINIGPIETFADFRARLARALERLTPSAPSGQRVAAFSSGGAIGALCASIVGADLDAALELGWGLNNASVSEVMWSGARVSLRRFNVVAHLPDPATWTYR